MNVVSWRRTAIAFGCAVWMAGPALAQPAKLSGYNADIRESSVSGISSGGVHGGSVRHRLVFGDQGRRRGRRRTVLVRQGRRQRYLQRLLVCRSDRDRVVHVRAACATSTAFFEKADAKSAAGDIDSLQFVRRQKIYVFHGYNDAVLARSVTDAAADFYRHYLGEANRGNLFYQTTIGAGHSLVVAQDQPRRRSQRLQGQRRSVYRPVRLRSGRNHPAAHLRCVECAEPRAVDRNDQAVRSVGLCQAGQCQVRSAWTRPVTCSFPRRASKARRAASTSPCMAASRTSAKSGSASSTHTGYNAWADSNRLIVLYPQTAGEFVLRRFNPQACWDWWSYVNHATTT